MGVVYEAFDRHKNAVVALKMLRSEDPNALRRFKEEFRGLADIAHENLVTLHELIADEGRWFFTLELVRGKNFYAAIRGDRSVNDDASVDAADETKPPARAYDVDVLRDRLRQLARGIHALHQA